MKLREIFDTLNRQGIDFVVIGGTALLCYGSSRVTLDTDIAIRALDTDTVAQLLLDLEMELVIGVNPDESPVLTYDREKAAAFLRSSDWGFMKFLGGDLELDIIYETPVPFARLLNSSKKIDVAGVEIHIASLEHLETMKEKSLAGRQDPAKRAADEADLKFIAGLRKSEK